MGDTDEELAEQLSMTVEDARRWRHSFQHPGFTGTYEFELVFDLLGHRVVRNARADYKYTPAWEYWDLQDEGLFTGWESWQVGMSLLTVAEPEEEEPPEDAADEVAPIGAAGSEELDDEDPDDPKPPAWVSLDLARDGMLPREVWERLYELIDEKCKAEDLERRRAKGM